MKSFEWKVGTGNLFEAIVILCWFLGNVNKFQYLLSRLLRSPNIHSHTTFSGLDTIILNIHHITHNVPENFYDSTDEKNINCILLRGEWKMTTAKHGNKVLRTNTPRCWRGTTYLSHDVMLCGDT